ncbi:MAG TPA: hypothetical protein VMW11_10680 [Candidatus Dormibacteraeota bacterium]|nr:hypothetical protein [Candidatus Dormibacteraeota bacterium]
MRFARAAISEVVGLFVADWVQSAVIVAILAAGWFAVNRLGAAALAGLVLLLAGQMVWFARAEARRAAR